MDIRIVNNTMTVDVLVDGEVVKSEKLTTEDRKNYIHEMVGDDLLLLEALRMTAMKMKPLSYTFKDVG